MFWCWTKQRPSVESNTVTISKYISISFCYVSFNNKYGRLQHNRSTLWCYMMFIWITNLLCHFICPVWWRGFYIKLFYKENVRDMVLEYLLSYPLSHHKTKIVSFFIYILDYILDLSCIIESPIILNFFLFEISQFPHFINILRDYGLYRHYSTYFSPFFSLKDQFYTGLTIVNMLYSLEKSRGTALFERLELKLFVPST